MFGGKSGGKYIPEVQKVPINKGKNEFERYHPLCSTNSQRSLVIGFFCICIIELTSADISTKIKLDFRIVDILGKESL